MVTLASVIPDFDGLGLVVDLATRHTAQPLDWWGRYHHVLGHNIGFALCCILLASAFSQQRLRTALLVGISFHLHLLGDLIGARGPDGDQWPIPYLLPFSKHPELIWSGQWALNAWPNMAITAALLFMTVLLARQRGCSPLQIFSSRADAAFVKAIRTRFPVKSPPGA